MTGKQARVLCPVCQEPIPPDETECENCGAFVIDEAVVRLSRALGLEREKALKLFDAGFRHPNQLRDRDPNRVLEKGEVGLLFICTNCGGFVAGGDPKCPRCAAEFETEAEAPTLDEEDILDLVLCPVCGADNDPDLVECEICGEALKESKPIAPMVAKPSPTVVAAAIAPAPVREAPENVDHLVRKPEPEIARPTPSKAPERVRPAPPPAPIPKPVSPGVRDPLTRPGRGESTSRPPPRPTPTIPPPPPPVTAPRPQLARSVPASKREAPLSSLRPSPASPSAPPQTKGVRTPRAAPIARKKVRRVGSALPGTGPETVGGLVLAAGAGLLIAGALGQHFVIAAIGVFLSALAAYGIAGLLRRRVTRPTILDALLLAGGSVLGAAAYALRGVAGGMTVAIGVALAASMPMGYATRRLVARPQRILLAIAGAVILILTAVESTLDTTYVMTIPWIIVSLAAMPWPAALAASDIWRRRTASALRRQLSRAERDVERREYERSLAEYDRAIAFTRAGVPGADIPWYGKGATLILLGRYEEALRAIDTALDINPRNEVAWVNKGNALTRMGRHFDALRCFNAAIKVKPTFEVAWNNKGNALARLGKFEEALQCYGRALEIDPGYRGAWMNKGFVLTKVGRFDEAASCADRVLHLQNSRRPEPA